MDNDIQGFTPDEVQTMLDNLDDYTTDEQFESHMCGVGAIENVKWITKGSAEVTYSSPEEAAAAVEQSRHLVVNLGNRVFHKACFSRNSG